MAYTNSRLRSHRTASATLLVITTALFAYSTLESMLAPALPAIQDAVGASPSDIAWVFTGLLLAGAVATPLVGRLADLRDKRTVFLTVLGIVAIGTAMAALARDTILLTAGQILQGVGISLVALSVGIIRDTQPAERIASANGLVIGASAASTAFGLVIAGPILEVLPYTWLYWIPLAVIISALVVAWAVVPSCPPVIKGRVDWTGAGLLALGLTAVLVGISRSSTLGWQSPTILTLVGAGLVVLLVFFLVESRTQEPLVDVHLMKQRSVLLVCAVAFVVGFGTFAVFVLVPMLVESPSSTGYGLGGSALATGLYLVPLGLVGAVAAPMTGRLERAIGSRGSLLIGTTAMVAAALALLASPGRPWLILVATALAGVTVGLGLTSAMNVVVASVPVERTASVSGLAFVAKSIGGTLGAQLGAVLLTRSADPVTAMPTWSGFQAAFVLAAGVSVVAVVMSLAMPSKGIADSSTFTDSRAAAV